MALPSWQHHQYSCCCSCYFARSREQSIAISLSTMYTMYWICTDHHFLQVNGRIATKLAHDGLQVSLRPRCAQGQGQGQRSRDTGTFVLARKSLHEDYWDTWNYSLFASSLQSTISCISIQFARWQHHCGRSLLSTIALLLLYYLLCVKLALKFGQFRHRQLSSVSSMDLLQLMLVSRNHSRSLQSHHAAQNQTALTAQYKL